MKDPGVCLRFDNGERAGTFAVTEVGQSKAASTKKKKSRRDGSVTIASPNGKGRGQQLKG